MIDMFLMSRRMSRKRKDTTLFCKLETKTGHMAMCISNSHADIRKFHHMALPTFTNLIESIGWTLQTMLVWTKMIHHFVVLFLQDGVEIFLRHVNHMNPAPLHQTPPWCTVFAVVQDGQTKPLLYLNLLIVLLVMTWQTCSAD